MVCGQISDSLHNHVYTLLSPIADLLLLSLPAASTITEILSFPIFPGGLIATHPPTQTPKSVSK